MERSELIKTLERYGGGVTYIAWLIYNYYTPELDENGNSKFSTEYPWRNCVFGEKKPLQFSKNFSSLIMSKEFREKATVGWSDVRENAVENGFEEILMIPPRIGTVRDVLGYNLGEKLPPVLMKTFTQ